MATPGHFNGLGQPIQIPLVTFDQVIGHDWAKEEMRRVIRGLHSPEKLKALGGELGAGCLLVGGSGIGKTFLAQALANECKCNFFLVEGNHKHLCEDESSDSEDGEKSDDNEESDNEDEDDQDMKGEEDVDVKKQETEKKEQVAEKEDKKQEKAAAKLSKIHHVFLRAASQRPAIVFLEDIETWKKHKNMKAALFKTLAAPIPNVYIIASTRNAFKGISKLLQRPSGLSHCVQLYIPSEKQRLQLFLAKTQDKPLHQDVKFEDFAAITTNYTGADIKDLCQEAIQEAFAQNLEKISRHCFVEVFQRREMGSRLSEPLSLDLEKRTAYHEAGHAIVSILLSPPESFVCITIIPGREFHGSIYEKELDEPTRPQMENEICVLFAGMCAEIQGMGSQSQGGEEDLNTIHRLLRQLITAGMIPELLLPISGGDFQGLTPSQRQFLEHYLQRLRLRTRSLLWCNRQAIEALVKELLKAKTLSRSQVIEIIRPYIVCPRGVSLPIKK